MGGRDLLIDQCLDVLVVDVFLAVGERLHSHERVFQLVGAQLVAHLLEPMHEGMTPGMLAEHQ